MLRNFDDISTLYELTTYLFTTIMQIKSKSKPQGHIFLFHFFHQKHWDVMILLLNQCFALDTFGFIRFINCCQLSIVHLFSQTTKAIVNKLILYKPSKHRYNCLPRSFNNDVSCWQNIIANWSHKVTADSVWFQEKHLITYWPRICQH